MDTSDQSKIMLDEPRRQTLRYGRISPGNSSLTIPGVQTYTRRAATALAGTAASFLLLAASSPRAPQPLAPASITFLANEGVLLTGGGHKILLDAFFGDYGPSSARPADSTQRQLERSHAPFDSVDVVLVTHRHGDHFGAREMALHLQSNPTATLVAPIQVIDSLLQYPPASQLPPTRVRGVTVPAGTRRHETINGVTIELLVIPHGGGTLGPRPEHLAYLVNIGGRRILHLGDSGTDEDAFAALRLDIALFPEWIIDGAEGRRLIARYIKPREIVTIHLARGATPRTDAATLNGAPVRRFARSLERLEW